MLQPTHLKASSRFVKDRVNVSDIAGATPDTYGKLKQIEGRDYLNVGDIEKTSPTHLPPAHSGPDFKLQTSDIATKKWQTKRQVNPLEPEYEMPSKSGRRMEKLAFAPRPKKISPQKNETNLVRDIEGASPAKLGSITGEMRLQATTTYSNGKRVPSRRTRNEVVNRGSVS